MIGVHRSARSSDVRAIGQYCPYLFTLTVCRSRSCSPRGQGGPPSYGRSGMFITYSANRSAAAFEMVAAVVPR